MQSTELPDGWQLKYLGDIAEENNGIVDGPFGSNLKKSDYIDDSINGVPVLTTKNLTGDYSNKSVRFVSKQKFEQLKRSAVKPNDILVAKIGSIGKTGLYPPNGRIGLIPANLLKVSVRPEISRDYVYYYINSPQLQKMIKDISTATAQPAFNVTKFRKLPIPLPNIKTQLSIVNRIEELLSELDKGVLELQTVYEHLIVYRQSVLKDAFERVIANNSRLSEITLKINDGTHKTPKYCSIGVPFVSAKDVNNSHVSFDNCKYITEEEHQQLIKRCHPEYGDVLLTKSGTIGRTAVVDTHKEFSLFESVALLKPLHDKVRTKYLMYGVDYILLGTELRKKVKGVAVRHLHLEDIRVAEIPLPSLDTQDQIIESIESKLSICDQIEHTVNQSLPKSQALRQSILKQAFEGKLV